MWRYEPRFLDPRNVESSQIMVKTPAGSELEGADPELARYLGEGVRVIKQYGGVFDTFPLSLLTVQSVDGLSRFVGQPLDSLRFRPNILIDSSEADPFPEEQWAGATLQIGTLRCRLDLRDKRCMMVNIDPSDLIANPDVLRAIARERAAQFGMYGTTVEPGDLSVGDPVLLEM